MLLGRSTAAPAIPLINPSMLFLLSAGNLAAAGSQLCPGLGAQLGLDGLRVLLASLLQAGAVVGPREQHLQIWKFDGQVCSPFLGSHLPNHTNIRAG
jgi:hypothetical protein